MDLSAFSVEELLLAGIRSEAEAREVYLAVAARVKNFLLRARLEFLAAEEEKHEQLLLTIRNGKFPGSRAAPPESSPVPLPALDVPSDATPLTTVFAQAMLAEKAAHDFYQALAARMQDDADVARMLAYMARMELGHYKLLEDEKKSAADMEDVDGVWPMTHVGP
jgi:rubrerythrin